MRVLENTLGLSLLVIVAASASLASGEGLVARNLADAASAWKPSPWNIASGKIGWSEDVPKEAGGATRQSLQLAVNYSGKGFEFFSIEPATGQIPGHCRRASVWVKAGAADYSWALKFKDADGNEQLDGKKLEWDLKAEAGRWTKLEFGVPSNWKQPIRLASLSAHNWNHKQKAAEAVLWVYDLRVETDIAGVADRSGLLKVEVGSEAPRNVFLEGEPVAYRIACDSWLGRTLRGTLSYRVTDAQGVEVAKAAQPVTVDGSAVLPIALRPEKFGAYRLSAELTIPEFPQFEKTSRFAYLPRPLTHTAEEKLASPYGLNIHGGQPGVDYEAIARTGFVWIRDYAYNRSWMLRARGEDGRYAGWPWYPKMDEQVRRSGLMLLPCLMDSISPYVAAGRREPDRAWKRELIDILLAFPQYPAWELDNEYDYRHGREEQARGWASYDAYHRLFGQVVKFMDDRVLAVEQGTAGIHPDWVRRSVKNGAFERIDAVNAHFYCGTTAPEQSTENANVGGEESGRALLFDLLRDLAAAADSDGRDRQAWITEFGWDTLAGHIVSEPEQAAYLQRGYLLGLQAGIDKMFWYWDRDTKEKPVNFFDGCGLFDPKDEPKPAAAALAALTHFLKQPTPVGTFEPGPNALGRVFRDRGQLVACLFAVDKDGPAMEIELPQGQWFDMYGNRLSARRQRLTIAPIWIVDLAETAPAYLQTAYSVQSPQLISVVAGDSVAIEARVCNNRREPISGRWEVKPPTGWTAESSGGEFSVPAGKSQDVTCNIRVPSQELAGSKEVELTFREGALQKALTTRLTIIPAADVVVEPLRSEPGSTRLNARVTNHSSQARSFVLSAQVPGNWRIAPEKTILRDIPGRQTQPAEFQIAWNSRWAADEQARVVVATPDGQPVTEAGIIPGAIPLARAASIVCDASLSEWPASARVPAWALGRRGDAPQAEIYLGHAPEGLYVGVKVARSKAAVTDPRSFWQQDCLELFLDTRNDKSPRTGYQSTDHQFWFCPLTREQRVYVGRWKRNAEIPATQYDIPDVKSACKREGSGYVYELLLPAAMIKQYASAPGRKLGVNLNLTTPSDAGQSELFWPGSKRDNVPTTPQAWGTAELQ
jgi:hypothetical protein